MNIIEAEMTKITYLEEHPAGDDIVFEKKTVDLVPVDFNVLDEIALESWARETDDRLPPEDEHWVVARRIDNNTAAVLNYRPA